MCACFIRYDPTLLRARAAAARRGVTFHDGTPWDAHACKANFDNIFPRGLMEYHGWYDLPLRTKDWQVGGAGAGGWGA